MPTFRDYKDDYKPLVLSKEKTQKWGKTVIFQKSHPNEEIAAAKYVSDNVQIVNITSLQVDTQELLAITDILITDYSSCYIDFLFTNRPIVFFSYDREEYFTYRKFAYDYDKYTPGPKVYNEDDLVNEISAYIKNPKKDLELRADVKKRFYNYTDGKSSERVYREILKLIEQKF